MKREITAATMLDDVTATYAKLILLECTKA